eukprot:COSAG03_NODE_1270_length_4382_cov_7.711347_5_plen_47_part_00
MGRDRPPAARAHPCHASASGDTDPDDDFYVPDGGSDGDDYGADDYY